MRLRTRILTTVLFAVFAVMLWGAAYYGPLLYVIPSVPEYNPQPIVGIDMYFTDTAKGMFLGTGDYSMEFYFDWYGMQTVGIIYSSAGPEGKVECAVYIQWTNGKETCITGPEE